MFCFLLQCRKTKHPDLHKWFCIETIKVCCPKGTFGPDCNGEEKAFHKLAHWFCFCSKKQKQNTNTRTYGSVIDVGRSIWFSVLKPVSGALKDLAMETGCATATGLAEGTESAPVTTVIKGSSAWTASTATSTKWGTTPSLCAQVHLNTHRPNQQLLSHHRPFLSFIYIRGKLWAINPLPVWIRASPPPPECHSSCKTCTGATNQDCDECKEGWEEDDQEACVGKRTNKVLVWV